MEHSVTNEQIGERAHELFVARGCEHGHDLEDWLAAENELRSTAEAAERLEERQSIAEIQEEKEPLRLKYATAAGHSRS